ncbi:hypothetical protein ANCCEY_10924 [Ancylostoma ceylanicum]|uniref:Uncharacterized protein n=1 Tax=Ancylostoma ceylanicum TaxID=53326 RepID=A0A0D6LDI5_9BILA|nr:hypothetical protein ANCCEY_10924 [Ancylostoma ceylanicum]
MLRCVRLQIMGSVFTQFLADSETQMILDMDFFKHFFNYAEAYRHGTEEGNLDLMRYAVKFVDKLKEFDVSSGKDSAKADYSVGIPVSLIKER